MNGRFRIRIRFQGGLGVPHEVNKMIQRRFPGKESLNMKTTILLASICAIVVAGCKTQAPPPPVASHPTATNQPTDSSAPTAPYVIHAPDGSCEITIDTSKAPDMTDWAEHKLAP